MTVRTLPEDVAVENHPSAVRVSPDGRFVYLGNRGHEGIGVLSAEHGQRLLATYPAGGRFSRDLAFDRDGRLLWVANERADVVVGLAADPADGSLVTTEQVMKLPKLARLLPVWPPVAPRIQAGAR